VIELSSADLAILIAIHARYHGTGLLGRPAGEAPPDLGRRENGVLVGIVPDETEPPGRQELSAGNLPVAVHVVLLPGLVFTRRSACRSPPTTART